MSGEKTPDGEKLARGVLSLLMFESGSIGLGTTTTAYRHDLLRIGIGFSDTGADDEERLFLTVLRNDFRILGDCQLARGELNFAGEQRLR